MLSVPQIVVEKCWYTLLCTALLRYHQNFNQMGHCNTLIIFFLWHSVVDLLLCLGSFHLIFFLFFMTQFQSSFSSQTDGLTFDSRIHWYTKEFMVYSRHPDSIPAKQGQIISPPPPCVTVSMRSLGWYAVYVLWPNILPFASYVYSSRSLVVCLDAIFQFSPGNCTKQAFPILLSC